MATHDEPTIDRALSVFARVKREFEAEHGPLPSVRDASNVLLNPRSGLVQFFTSRSGEEKVAASARTMRRRLTGCPSLS